MVQAVLTKSGVAVLPAAKPLLSPGSLPANLLGASTALEAARRLTDISWSGHESAEVGSSIYMTLRGVNPTVAEAWANAPDAVARGNALGQLNGDWGRFQESVATRFGLYSPAEANAALERYTSMTSRGVVFDETGEIFEGDFLGNDSLWGLKAGKSLSQLWLSLRNPQAAPLSASLRAEMAKFFKGLAGHSFTRREVVSFKHFLFQNPLARTLLYQVYVGAFSPVKSVVVAGRILLVLQEMKDKDPIFAEFFAHDVNLTSVEKFVQQLARVALSFFNMSEHKRADQRRTQETAELLKPLAALRRGIDKARVLFPGFETLLQEQLRQLGFKRGVGVLLEWMETRVHTARRLQNGEREVAGL